MFDLYVPDRVETEDSTYVFFDILQLSLLESLISTNRDDEYRCNIISVIVKELKIKHPLLDISSLLSHIGYLSKLVRTRQKKSRNTYYQHNMGFIHGKLAKVDCNLFKRNKIENMQISQLRLF